MKVIMPLEINIKCNSKCSKCKWNQKPSTCEPWDNWRIKNQISSSMFLLIARQADKYFGVENLIVEEST